MKAPKGMAWIDVAYLAERINYERQDGVFRGEAGMRLLIDRAAAEWLMESGPLADVYMERLEDVLRARERLCGGRYVGGSAAVKIVEDEED